MAGSAETSESKSVLVAEKSAEAAVEEVPIEEVVTPRPTSEHDWYSNDYPQMDRALNVLTARPARRGSFIFLVDHRNNQTFEKDAFYKFLGFDGGGLKIGLGLRYGAYDNLDVGIYRLNGTIEGYDTYEFDARYQLLKAEKFYVNVAARAGLSWFSQPGHQASGYFGQLLVDRTLFDRWTVGANFAYHSSSSNDRKTNSDSMYSLGVMGFSELRIVDNWAWVFEIADGFAGYHSKWPIMATGAKIITNRHTFAVTISNSQYMTTDGLVSNTWRSLKDLIVGFNITREF